MLADFVAVGENKNVVDVVPWKHVDREGRRHLVVKHAFVHGEQTPPQLLPY
jgi:hypothetical protein